MPKHRHLIVDGKLRTTGLRDEFEGPLKPRDLELPHEIWKELTKWVREYTDIQLLDDEKMGSDEARQKINALDLRGIELAKDIQKNLGLEHKVRYYSAGLQEYIQF